MKKEQAFKPIETLNKNNTFEYFGILRDLDAIREFLDLIKDHEATKSIYNSWGVSAINFGTWRNDAAAILTVNGLYHKGETIIIYNVGNDTYKVANIDENGELCEINNDVYIDILVGELDEHIERPNTWTDEEYIKRAEAAAAESGIDLKFLSQFKNITIF